MKLEQFDKTVLSSLRPEINAALKAVGEKYGIALQLGNMSFSEKTFTAKLEGAISAGGKSPTEVRYEADYITYAKMFSLPEEGLGSRFFSGGMAGKVYVCAGLKLKRGGGAQLVVKEEGSEQLVLLSGNFQAIKWECLEGEKFNKR